MLFGIACTVTGYTEVRIARRCSAEPERVEVEQLEQGYRPNNDHLTLGPHWALRDGSVYERFVPEGETKESIERAPHDREAMVTNAFYPVVSIGNPLATIGAPANGIYSVLIKTNQYGTVGRFLDAMGDGTPLREETLTGVVVNVIEPLTIDQRKLLSRSFPLVSLEHVLILQQGRRPKPLFTALFMLVFGICVMLSPIALWISKRMPAMAPGAVGRLTPRPSYNPIPDAPPATPSQQPPPYGPPSGSGYSAPPGAIPAGDSIPPTSARLQPGARVRVSRKNGDVFGSVVKVQAGQASVNIDNGPTVWVATDVIALE